MTDGIEPTLAELEIRSELFDAMDGNLRMSKRHKLLDAYREAVLAAELLKHAQSILLDGGK